MMQMPQAFKEGERERWDAFQSGIIRLPRRKVQALKQRAAVRQKRDHDGHHPYR